MSKPGRKTQEMKQVSFRMPADVHADYAVIAESRGVDLSALLNWVVVDYRPVLLTRYAQHGAAMLRAVAMGLPSPLGAGAGPDPQDTLDRLKELIGNLQEVESKLSAWVGGAAKSAA